MASPTGSDLELQPSAPLLESRGRDNKWRFWPHLPRRDTSLATFLVKSAGWISGGLLTLNVLNATHFLATSRKEEAETRLDICFASSTEQPLKAIILSIPFILYPVTQWIGGLAKMSERDRRGLSTASLAVIIEYILFILVTGLFTHCMAEATIWCVTLGVVIAIVLLLFAWTVTFNRPRCLRWFCCNCCCFGLAPDIAAAQANDQSIAAEEMARQVVIAQEAFAVQVRLQNEAFAARARAREAAEAKRVAEEAAAKASEDLQAADNAMRVREAAMEEAKAEADRTKDEMDVLARAASEQGTEVAAQQASSEMEQSASTNASEEINLATEKYSRTQQKATDAIRKYEEATKELNRSQAACNIANQTVAEATCDEATKKQEYMSANDKVVRATTAAENAFEKAAAARSVVLL